MITNTIGSGQNGYMRSKETAAYLHVSVRTLINLRRRRLIPYLKIGRLVLFSVDEVRKAVEQFRIDAINIHPDRR